MQCIEYPCPVIALLCCVALTSRFGITCPLSRPQLARLACSEAVNGREGHFRLNQLGSGHTETRTTSPALHTCVEMALVLSCGSISARWLTSLRLFTHATLSAALPGPIATSWHARTHTTATPTIHQYRDCDTAILHARQIRAIMSFLGFKAYPTPVLKPVLPFIIGGFITFYAVSKAQTAALQAPEYRDSPKNPYRASAALAAAASPDAGGGYAQQARPTRLNRTATLMMCTPAMHRLRKQGSLDAHRPPPLRAVLDWRIWPSRSVQAFQYCDRQRQEAAQSRAQRRSGTLFGVCVYEKHTVLLRRLSLLPLISYLPCHVRPERPVRLPGSSRKALALLAALATDNCTSGNTPENDVRACSSLTTRTTITLAPT